MIMFMKFCAGIVLAFGLITVGMATMNDDYALATWGAIAALWCFNFILLIRE